MISARSHRWQTTPRFDVDAFALTDKRWLLFAYVKEPALATDHAFWRALALQFKGGEVMGLAGALKTEKGSEPLESLAAAPGGEMPSNVWCREGWLKYRLETSKVLNPGLFLDQELNRHQLVELVQHHISRYKGEFGENDGLLNLFSYTGSFSIAALGAGVRATTSVDVSARYLAWEKENFEANFGGHDQLTHRLINDDARDFLRRAAKKGTRYRWIVIDPPTFSRGQGRAFKIQEDLVPMLTDAIACLTPGGAILASGNDARWDSRDFHAAISKFAREQGLRVDRGLTPAEFGSAHALKSAWLFAVDQ